ncbi:MAG: hypothetical protein IPL53_20550, partial [Ignavibacteria bacterium]|nr:hypothetical protein [Ignavibacteria bacterium]
MSIGNVIQYFVVAQDLAFTPNVGINSGIFTSAPSDVNLTSAVFPLTGSINSYTIVNNPLAGDYLISATVLNRLTGLDITFKRETEKVSLEVMEKLPGGIEKKNRSKSKNKSNSVPRKIRIETDKIVWTPMSKGGTYKGDLYVKRNENPQFQMDNISGVYYTITAAVEDLNLRGADSEVRFLLDDSLYENETLPITINPWSGASGSNTLTIKPNDGVSSKISGSSPSAVFIINGADHVIIDGSSDSVQNSICPEATASRDLTIVNNNSNTSSAVVWLQSNFSNGASDNKIRNCNIEGLSNSNTLFGIGSGSSIISVISSGINNDNNIYENNSISKTQYGIYSQGEGTANKNTGTVISQNLLNKNYPDNIRYCGIQVGFENDVRIAANKIENLETDGTLTAIAAGLSSTEVIISSTTGNEVTNAVIENNIINNIKSTDSLGFSAIGISVAYASSGINTIVNNMISGLNALSSSPDFTSGIFSGGGTGTTHIYFNTVSLSGTRGNATFPSFSLSLGGTSSVADIRNNILVNNQTSSDAGKSYAIGLGYANYSNLISNNNDLFTSGASGKFSKAGGLQQNIGTDHLSLLNWQTATGKDSLSKNVQPVFSSPYLHILNTDSSNLINLANTGNTVSVNTDIDCDPRVNSFPDIGADEFDGLENSPPSISFTLLTNTNNVSNRVLSNVTITDSDGIDTTPGNNPRIYFKKVGDGNDFAGWKFTQATNNVSPYEFTIDYSLLSGITYGDTIQYFVTAQDLQAEPSVSINSGTFASAPVSVALTAAAFPISGTINSYKINDAPSISYTVLTNTNSISNRVLSNVTITDSDGIDTAGNSPRVYYK